MTLAIIISGIGIILILILFLRLKEELHHQKLKKHHQVDEGLADLLNYAAVIDDGIIVGKNGALMAAWLYQGPDNESSTEREKDSLTLNINKALQPLGNGWMLHVDAVRKPAPSYSERGRSQFPDPISFALDEERRAYFNQLGALYEGYFVLSLTYFPPVLAERKFTELMFDDEGKDTGESSTQRIITQFKQDISNFESRLSISLGLKRLKGVPLITEEGKQITQDDFLSWLQYCVTGLTHPVNLPDNPMYIDRLIGGQELYTGITPLIGKKFIQVVGVDGFPMDIVPTILARLAELPMEYRWSNRFIFMDQHEALAHLEKHRKKWKQKIRGFIDQMFNTNSGQVNQDAVAMVADADAAIAETNSGEVSQGYYTSVIILMDEDRDLVEKSAIEVSKQINSLGFTARVETINTMDAFMGSLPMHGVENVRRPLINTLNLSALIPTSSIWTGLNYAPCDKYPPHSPALMSTVTHGQTPFRLNLHVHDVGHTLIFGPTTAGKSTLLALICAQLLRYPRMSIYAFDKGMSLFPLVSACGGSHYEVGGDDDQLAFAPLSYLDTPSDIAWASEWIDIVLGLNNLITTAAQRNAINDALVTMSKSDAKTISEFYLLIQDETIRETLKSYTVDGPMGHLLDAEQDGLTLADSDNPLGLKSRFNVFEIEELMNLGNKYALPVLLYLFRRIERNLKGQPAAIVLDEAWLMLGHPVFKEKIREWLKVLRKANCLVIMATQSLSDTAKSGILDVIKESTATKIFLPNIYANDDESLKLYHDMGLNSRQIEIIATAIPKRQYYFMSAQGRRLFELAIGDLTMAFVGANDKDSIAHIKRLIKEYGEDWPYKWLEHKEVDYSSIMN